MDGGLLAGLAIGGRPVAAGLHADKDARAALALYRRYRREADADLRRSLDALAKLHEARAGGPPPGGVEADAAQAALDADLADTPEPSEPRVEKVEARQPVATPANDDRTDAPLRPVELTGRRVLEVDRYHERHVPGRAALLDAAEADGRAVDTAPERRAG